MLDGLRTTWIVPEGIMFFALLLVSAQYVLRLRLKIRPTAQDGRIAMTIIAFMFGVQALLYGLIWMSGNRSGLAWLIRLNLLFFAVLLNIHSGIIIWKYRHGTNNRHYRTDRNIGGSGGLANRAAVAPKRQSV